MPFKSFIFVIGFVTSCFFDTLHAAEKYEVVDIGLAAIRDDNNGTCGFDAIVNQNSLKIKDNAVQNDAKNYDGLDCNVDSNLCRGRVGVAIVALARSHSFTSCL